MTHQHATRVANVIIGVAAAGAAYYVLRTPSLRRMAWRIAATAVATTLPAWFNRELRDAWTASARAAEPARDRALARDRDMMTA